MGFDITREDVIGAAANKLLQHIAEDYDENYGHLTETVIERALERIAKQRREAVEAAIEEAVTKATAETAEFDFAEYIESIEFGVTNRWGEVQGERRKLRDHIHHMVEAWLVADVNWEGKSKAEADSYGFKVAGKRIPVLVSNFIRDDVERAVKAALAEVGKRLSQDTGEMVKTVINERLDAVKVSFGKR